MPVNPQAVIAEAQAEAVRKDRARQQQQDEYRHESAQRRKKMAEFIHRYLRQARVEDYHEWLRGYILNGGTLGNAYDRPTNTHNMFVAVADIEKMPQLYGAMALEVIIPNGLKGPVEEDPRAFGHSKVYYMDGFRISGGNRPAVYNDIKF